MQGDPEGQIVRQSVPFFLPALPLLLSWTPNFSARFFLFSSSSFGAAVMGMPNLAARLRRLCRMGR